MKQIDHLQTARRAGDSRPAAPRLLAFGGLLGALAASSCCILPLAFFGLGVGGAWIGQLTALAPYQPLFVTFALGCLAVGFWRVYRPAVACAVDGACGQPLPDRLVKASLWIATILVLGAVGFDYLAPFLLGY
jgi:mercuric ion transport protein